MTISTFSTDLITWYNTYQRDLPWRKTYNPYHIWISEIMLQQTQMTRGVEYFIRWVERFPTVHSVATASIEELYKYWEGLGYYSRVRNIHATAKRIVEEYNGEIPADYIILQSFSGIGKYTAGAIASIAFTIDVPAVDANVLRIFTRLFGISTCISEKSTLDTVEKLVQKELPTGNARIFNQALMELGALLCSKNPLCEKCPIQNFCHAYSTNTQSLFPQKIKQKATVSYTTVAILLVYKGTLLSRKRANYGVWANFWEFPEYKVDTTDNLLETACSLFTQEYAIPIEITKVCKKIHYTYTHHKVELHTFYARTPIVLDDTFLHDTRFSAKELAFYSPKELQQHTFSSGQNKAIKEYLKSLQL